MHAIYFVIDSEAYTSWRKFSVKQSQVRDRLLCLAPTFKLTLTEANVR